MVLPTPNLNDILKMKQLLLPLIFVLSWVSTTAQKSENEILKFSMDTPWTDQVDEEKPWNLYPRPQMKRANWTNLNGLWEYAIRPMESGMPKTYDGDILVPFPVESELSQVKKLVNEEEYLWYRTTFDAGALTADQVLQLNFGAVDWEAIVYINGKVAGGHKGGFTPFSLDITPYLKKGPQELVVRVWDPTDKGTQARGKQVQQPQGIWYTPVTGIWQTVWLEKLSADHLQLIKTTPNIDNETLRVQLETSSLSTALRLHTKVLANGKEIVTKTQQLSLGQQMAGLEFEIPDMRLWGPEDPYLYDLEFTLINAEGELVDKVESYFGMRKISLGKDHNGYTSILLNNEAYFQFGLLDQGWWPDGLYTAPTEEAMLYDVEMTRAMGFNMLRKHVKVEPARFYYHCDRMGMLVWQDMPNGNYFQDLRIEAWEEQDAERSYDSSLQFETELREMMDYFHNFPSIVVWVPFNEGWGQYDTERVTQWVTAYDPSRIVDSPSGWSDRGVGDLVDIHIYPGPGMEPVEEHRASVIGEFGGLGLTVEDHMWWDKKNWGYLTFKEPELFEARFKELVEDLIGLKSFGLSAAIYTQTTDVEGEVNGLITYDREILKVDPEVTTEMFAPLYLPAEDHKILLSDAEAQPAYWLMENPGSKESRKWTSPDFKDSKWNRAQAPFSSYDNYFLPEGTKIHDEVLRLRREFTLEEVPSEIDLRYYLDKASMRVFINGQEVVFEEFKGGRQRHYRIKRVKHMEEVLKKGRNVIAVEIVKQQKDHSFDLGIYLTGLKDAGEETN